MKKMYISLLSVMILALVGCGSEQSIEPTEVAVVENEVKEEVSSDNQKEVELMESSNEDSTESEITTEFQQSVATEQTTETEETTECSEPTKQQEEPKPSNTTQQEETKPTEPKKEEAEKKPEKEEPQKEEPEQETTEKPVEKVEEKQGVGYDPYQVVALATEKTKALGKISIPEDLDNMLANGEITKEEYDAYYPYDGAGYYSVFVETDLNEASTTSGRKLESVEGIADYISGMLALETGPYFYIEYTGITNTGGKDFYEFRCYRA